MAEWDKQKTIRNLQKRNSQQRLGTTMEEEVEGAWKDDHCRPCLRERRWFWLVCWWLSSGFSFCAVSFSSCRQRRGRSKIQFIQMKRRINCWEELSLKLRNSRDRQLFNKCLKLTLPCVEVSSPTKSANIFFQIILPRRLSCLFIPHFQSLFTCEQGIILRHISKKTLRIVSSVDRFGSHRLCNGPKIFV